jgi:hypothetical protein
MSFQVALEASSRCFSHTSCAAPMKALSSLSHAPAVGRIGAAIAALVEHEHVERRPEGEAAIDPLGILGIDAHGVVLEQRPLRPCRQQRGAALLVVALVADDLAGIPVVADFLVVPLHQERHLGGKAALVLVHEVLGEGAAVIRQALRHLRLARRGQVLPGAAIIGGHLLIGLSA